jgi:hypothetical protein
MCMSPSQLAAQIGDLTLFKLLSFSKIIIYIMPINHAL